MKSAHFGSDAGRGGGRSLLTGAPMNQAVSAKRRFRDGRAVNRA